MATLVWYSVSDQRRKRTLVAQSVKQWAANLAVTGSVDAAVLSAMKRVPFHTEILLKRK